MAEENRTTRTGPGPTDPELHERICSLRIATSPHSSGMLQRGGNVFPLICENPADDNPAIANEPD